jgi:hypothetical protein
LLPSFSFSRHLHVIGVWGTKHIITYARWLSMWIFNSLKYLNWLRTTFKLLLYHYFTMTSFSLLVQNNTKKIARFQWNRIEIGEIRRYLPGSVIWIKHSFENVLDIPNYKKNEENLQASRIIQANFFFAWMSKKFGVTSTPLELLHSLKVTSLNKKLFSCNY